MPLIKPQQLEAERALISCLLENAELFYTIEGTLLPERFFGLDNAEVYKAFVELLSQGHTPDIILIKNFLGGENKLELIGGDAYFEQLKAIEHLTSNINLYVKLILDTAILRDIIDTGAEIREAGYNKTAEEALGVVFNKADSLLNSSSLGVDSQAISELAAAEFQALVERLKNPGCDGIPTGFADYDLLTGGLYKTDQIIIAARPSMGKTTLALRYMLNLANRVPCMLFSYEMSRQQLLQRMFAMESGVNLTKIKTGMVNTDEYSLVADAAKKVGNLPIYINNNPIASVAEVVTEARKMIRKKGVGIVVVDYIQLMPYSTENATQDLGNISRRLKNLAMGGDVTVVVLSQLNRLVELRSDKIPILSDLRQSGNLEEHADIVLMLRREEFYMPTPENRGVADFYIRKNRNGPIGSLLLEFLAGSVDFAGRFSG